MITRLELVLGAGLINLVKGKGRFNIVRTVDGGGGGP